MPLPRRSETGLAEEYLRIIKEDVPALRVQLAEKSKGGKITNIDRLKQLTILEKTLSQLEMDQRSERQDLHLSAQDQLKTIIGALLWVQMDIVESYKKECLPFLGNCATLGVVDFTDPDASKLHVLINQIVVLQQCLEARKSDIPSSVKDSETKKTRPATEEEIKAAKVSARDVNMREALRAFWNLYIKHTYDQKICEDARDTTQVDFLPKLSGSLFNDAFDHLIKKGLSADKKEQALGEQERRFFRQIKRFQLHKEMNSYENCALMEDEGKYRKDPQEYIKYREVVLDHLYKPAKQEQVASKDTAGAKSSWLSFWSAAKKEEGSPDRAEDKQASASSSTTATR